MTTSPLLMTLTEADSAEIQLLCDIAKANGSHLSVREALMLLQLDVSEQKFLEAWNESSVMSQRFVIQSGLILPKEEIDDTVALESKENERKRRAETNLLYAAEFDRFNRDDYSRLVSVSGSSSYGSVSSYGDVDFFCIARNGTLWFFITRSLILARVFRLLRKGAPSLCFSYVMDEDYAKRTFSLTRDALFARDALQATVLKGQPFYIQLLRKNPWLATYFPKFYETRATANVKEELKEETRGPSFVEKAVNLFLYFTVGSYLRLKAHLGNRRLTSQGRFPLLFTSKIGKDHCIYESIRYRDLRRLYAQLKRTDEPNHLPSRPLETGSERLKLTTQGRATCLPHIVELRYALIHGAYYLLSGRENSDWVLNAVKAGRAKLTLQGSQYQVQVQRSSPLERANAHNAFIAKYGSRIVQEWYSVSSICLKLTPQGFPITTGVVKGEGATNSDYANWRLQNSDYYAGVAAAFDSASEEYDFTISHNFINTWIRRRSIEALLQIARREDVAVEIGCGTGTEAILIAPYISRIIATDISEQMLGILRLKIRGKKLAGKIVPFKARACEISKINEVIDGRKVPLVYSFNGALNCEPRIERFVDELSQIVTQGGHFVCSVRNNFCLSEAVSHALVLQFDKMTPRKKQPILVSVGGMDIPSMYYSARRFAEFFTSGFKLKSQIALPGILPPAYLNDYYLKLRRLAAGAERLEPILSPRFPLNQFGDQTLFIFQKR